MYSFIEIMTDLIVHYGAGSGARKHAQKVIEGEEWEKVYIITNPEFKKEIRLKKTK